MQTSWSSYYVEPGLGCSLFASRSIHVDQFIDRMVVLKENIAKHDIFQY